MRHIHTVSLNEMSTIQVSAQTWSTEQQGRFPHTLLIKLKGLYRPGGEGAADATFCLAWIKAYRSAYFAPMCILDLTELTYTSGGEMQWLYDATWCPIFRYRTPLALWVGPTCKEALRSLAPEDYQKLCFETLDEAVLSVEKQETAFKEYKRTFKRTSSCS